MKKVIEFDQSMDKYDAMEILKEVESFPGYANVLFTYSASDHVIYML